MRYFIRLAVLAIACSYPFRDAWAQEGIAGPDKIICADDPVVKLGAPELPDHCYFWLQDKNFLFGTTAANPAIDLVSVGYGLTTFNVKRLSKGLDKQIETDEMNLTKVRLRNITFDDATSLPADGQSTMGATFRADFIEDPAVKWEIIGDDLGATISGTGETTTITSGTEAGAVMVRASLEKNDKCYVERELIIGDVVGNVVARDKGTDHGLREARTGETLHLIGDRDAQITAEPVAGVNFNQEVPIWHRNSTRLGSEEGKASIDGRVGFLTTSYSAGPTNKTVDLEWHDGVEESFTVDVGRKFDDLKNRITSKLNITGATDRLSVAVSGQVAVKEAEVEKYDSPDYGIKRDITIDATGSLSGKVPIPWLTRELRSEWLDVSASLETYVKATATINGRARFTYDPSKENNRWQSMGNLSGGLGLKVELGVELAGQAGRYEVRVAASGSTNIALRAKVTNEGVFYDVNGGDLSAGILLELVELPEKTVKYRYRLSRKLLDGFHFDGPLYIFPQQP